ncbi:hypothetical protein CC86DRAFT_467296 [Ophiobolus disseminans]|uniref:Uncharacterized protein n=1 Tax=Ophiobolus disseminans TaxID=1469910 RepID=A0A6A6ZYL2_9PLEO|nr:hypothetical protein CC86DRAFT_467296 [Ophiobolus disseminans]
MTSITKEPRPTVTITLAPVQQPTWNPLPSMSLPDANNLNNSLHAAPAPTDSAGPQKQKTALPVCRKSTIEFVRWRVARGMGLAAVRNKAIGSDAECRAFARKMRNAAIFVTA